MKKRVTGIGGVFFKAKNPKKLGNWYRDRLGIPVDPNWGGWAFQWREDKSPRKRGQTVWSPFPAETGYFKPSKKQFMVNYRVANLKRVLKELRAEGVSVDERMEESEYGKFGWIMDPEGNRIELWQPPAPRRKKR
ncbi:MAG TPA: VOC family protein [Opitutaceae bacterium]|nr:VOC family protein [Opitutaceae bacterium]